MERIWSWWDVSFLSNEELSSGHSESTGALAKGAWKEKVKTDSKPNMFMLQFKTQEDKTLTNSKTFSLSVIYCELVSLKTWQMAASSQTHIPLKLLTLLICCEWSYMQVWLY